MGFHSSVMIWNCGLRIFMKIVAYVMAADPAYLQSSVSSYYQQVDKIVVTYDRNHLGWTGKPVRTNQCLSLLRHLDVDNKCLYFEGDYARPEYFSDPNKNETFQRNRSLDIARQYGDWILQLDTDEVLPKALVLSSLVSEAVQHSCTSVWYPMLWIFSVNRRGVTVASNRRLVPIADFPGPILLERNQRVVYSRHEANRSTALSFACNAVLGSVPETIVITKSLSWDELIYHYSIERSESDFQMKAQNNGHAFEVDWALAYRRWKLAKSSPLMAVFLGILSRKTNSANKFTHLRYLHGVGTGAIL